MKKHPVKFQCNCQRYRLTVLWCCGNAMYYENNKKQLRVQDFFFGWVDNNNIVRMYQLQPTVDIRTIKINY